jgi:hypothetical protein
MSFRAWLLGIQHRLVSSISGGMLRQEPPPAADIRRLERTGPFRHRIIVPRETHGGRPIAECPCYQCRTRTRRA